MSIKLNQNRFLSQTAIYGNRIRDFMRFMEVDFIKIAILWKFNP